MLTSMYVNLTDGIDIACYLALICGMAIVVLFRPLKLTYVKVIEGFFFPL